MEFMYYGPVYLQVKADSSTIAWRKKDDAKATGYGYDAYMSSKIHYEINTPKNELNIEVFHLNRSPTARK